MVHPQYNISLALGLNERYDHRVAVGIIKFSRDRPDWRLSGNEWLFRTVSGKRADRPDGIIARITDRKTLGRLLSYKVPIVDVAYSFEDPRLPVVCNDDLETGLMAGRHFLAKGFNRFAYAGIDEAIWSRRRREGLWQAVREVQDGDLPVFNVAISWLRREHNLNGLAKWLAKLPKPCAVLAANDLIGYRVSTAARMAGIAVPHEVAIMGVDSEEVFCELSEPRLSSISCDCERIGMEAANLLAQLINGEDPLRQMVIPPLDIDARESTDIIIGQDGIIREVKNYIRINIGRGINVADVAEAFPMSRRALEKRFLQHEGQTIHDELIRVRLEKSCSLLTAGTSISAACYESGFASLQHFYHAFKRRYNLTPAQFASWAGK